MVLGVSQETLDVSDSWDQTTADSLARPREFQNLERAQHLPSRMLRLVICCCLKEPFVHRKHV